MQDWMGGNTNGIAIVRVSSRRQEGNISHETQEKEIRQYCTQNKIKLNRVVKITESAKDSEDRRQYTEAMLMAREDGIRHFLFYMYDRESRNLTDNEANEKLVRLDKICLHYVRENKVLHRGSGDSDFFMRDMQAATSKQFIRNLTAKVNDSMRTKAESGVYPSNNPPLGYATRKRRDEDGKELRGGTTIGIDPVERNVKQVLREFELRANGYTYPQIRERIIEEGLISPKKISTYNKATIEKRINNPFYEGRFTWQGIEYQGTHELFVPEDLIRRAREVRRASRVVRPEDERGVFAGGFMTCAECECNIQYDPKTKHYKTGPSQTYHYYHCSNGRKLHTTMAGLNVQESVLWDQFDMVIESITIPEALAKKIGDALNEGHKEIVGASVRSLDALKKKLKVLDEKEARAFSYMDTGVIDHELFKAQIQRLRMDRAALNQEMVQSQSQINGNYRSTAHSTLELCKEAKSLYLSRSAPERRNFLKRVLSNPRLRGSTIEYDLKKPYQALAEINENGKWWTQISRFRTDCASFQGEYVVEIQGRPKTKLLKLIPPRGRTGTE